LKFGTDSYILPRAGEENGSLLAVM